MGLSNLAREDGAPSLHRLLIARRHSKALASRRPRDGRGAPPSWAAAPTQFGAAGLPATLKKAAASGLRARSAEMRTGFLTTSRNVLRTSSACCVRRGGVRNSTAHLPGRAARARPRPSRSLGLGVDWTGAAAAFRSPTEPVTTLLDTHFILWIVLRSRAVGTTTRGSDVTSEVGRSV